MKPAPTDPPEVQAALWDGVRGQVGWDIGANCGQTLPEMTHRFRRVYAFEPAQECWPALDEWCNSVTVLHVAISDHTGQVSLAALPDKIDTGQLVTPGTQGMEWSPDWPSVTGMTREVECTTVDNLVFGERRLPPPSFIKIDVEGHEAHVLDGAKYTIQTYVPRFLIEFHTPELCQRIREDLIAVYGYRVVTVRHPHYPPGSRMWSQHGWLLASYPT